MKRFQLILAAAVVIAVGSSFTVLSEKTDDQIYIDVDGQRTPIEEVSPEDGECLPSGPFCKYTLDTDGVTKLPVDPGFHWEDED